MKKPVNKFALTLWIMAAIYIAVQVWALVHIMNLTVSAHMSYPPLWDGLESIVKTSALLASLGVVIELLDRILWQLRTPDSTN